MFCESGQDVCPEFVCTFAGHRQVFEPKIEERVKETLESLTGRGRRLVFLCGAWASLMRSVPAPFVG